MDKVEKLDALLYIFSFKGDVKAEAKRRIVISAKDQETVLEVVRQVKNTIRDLEYKEFTTGYITMWEKKQLEVAKRKLDTIKTLVGLFAFAD